MRRLFVAVWPPPSLISVLGGLTRPPRDGLRWTTEDQWHVTLRFLGSVGADQEAEARSRLGEVAAQVVPVAARAGPAPGPVGRTIWAVPVEGLDPLAAAIVAGTRQLGQPPSHRRFRGHITLGRARQPPALVGLPSPPLDERWTVGEITLVRSDLQPDGARYEVIDRWRLGFLSGSE